MNARVLIFCPRLSCSIYSELVRSGRCREVCAGGEATEEFDRARTEAAKRTVWATGCRSWYLDDRGIPMAWPWTFDRFRDEMVSPNLDHYDLVS